MGGMCACVGGECVHVWVGSVWMGNLWGGICGWDVCMCGWGVCAWRLGGVGECACVSGECVCACVCVSRGVCVCVSEVGGTAFLQSRGCGRLSLTGERGSGGS